MLFDHTWSEYGHWCYEKALHSSQHLHITKLDTRPMGSQCGQFDLPTAHEFVWAEKSYSELTEKSYKVNRHVTLIHITRRKLCNPVLNGDDFAP